MADKLVVVAALWKSKVKNYQKKKKKKKRAESLQVKENLKKYSIYLKPIPGAIEREGGVHSGQFANLAGPIPRDITIYTYSQWRITN